MSMSASTSTTKQKMLYRLERDEDGYPPVSFEGLWVHPTGSGTVILDNIPFYAKGIAPGDELAIATAVEGEIWFETVVKAGGGSVFRIHSANDIDLLKIREELIELGASSEIEQGAQLIAVEISETTEIKLILNYLVIGSENNRFDFEEAVLRHNIN